MAVSGEAVIARFLALVGAGQVADVTALLEAAPALVNAVGPHPFWGGRPQALHLAVEGNRRDLFDLLIARGADVSGSNEQYDHWSPLMLALNRTRDEMRDELLRRGARVGALEALMLGDDDALDRLLGGGPLPAIAPNGGSMLALARTPWAIDRLLALGAPVHLKDRWGATPIEAMSRLGARGRPIVAALVSHGVQAGPAEYARMSDFDRLLELVDRDPSVAKRDDVMMAAVDFRHHAMVAWLIERGAPVNARSEAASRHTALHSAAWNGDIEMARLLVAAGADLSIKDEQYGAVAAGWAETSVEVTNNAACAEVAEFLKGAGG
jgi:ankyrin repeat protein